jgi:hypothetical protein
VNYFATHAAISLQSPVKVRNVYSDTERKKKKEIQKKGKYQWSYAAAKSGAQISNDAGRMSDAALRANHMAAGPGAAKSVFTPPAP